MLLENDRHFSRIDIICTPVIPNVLEAAAGRQPSNRLPSMVCWAVTSPGQSDLSAQERVIYISFDNKPDSAA